MHELKPLSKEAIPAALAKAERYRLLNECEMAESICEDILAADPDDQRALVIMALAITDQFRGHDVAALVRRARALLLRLTDEYERLYYGGIVCERRARAHLAHGGPGSGAIAADWFAEALRLFEQSMLVRPAGNDDAVLRWNACARTLNRRPDVQPESELPPSVVESDW